MNTEQTNLLGPCLPLAALSLAVATLLAGPVLGRADTIYVSNTGENTIRKFTSDGAGSVFAAGLSAPEGLAFDRLGNLYVANYGNNTIMRFTPGGVGSVFANTGLLNPTGLAFDRAGNLYVSNAGSYDYGLQNYHSYIEKFTPGGVGSFFADATASEPAGLACDSAGNLYAAYSEIGKIEKFTPGGVGSVFCSTGFFSFPEGLAFDGAGNLYVANARSIERFSPNGVDLGAFASGLFNPTGLAFDSAGNLYAANYSSNGNVERFTPGGLGSVFASGLVYPDCIAIIPEPSAVALLGLGIMASLASRPKSK